MPPPSPVAPAAATGFGAGGGAGVAGTAAATGFLAGPLAIGLRAGDVAAFAFLAGALAIAFLAVGLRAGDLAALALLAGALARARFAAVLSAGFFAADFFVVLVAAATFFFPVIAFFVFFALLKLVKEAGRELAAQLATDVLIIEDEPLIALDLEALVENLGHKVIGVARTRTEAVTIVRTKQPGLILADIQLADGSSGLDAVNDLLNAFEVPVVFITAYPERFLTGERPEPAYLISKPYQLATVSALVSQALFFERNAVQRKKRAS